MSYDDALAARVREVLADRTDVVEKKMFGGPMGTGYYCSAEQWATGRGGVTGDVYSLGVVLAELATGRAVPITPVGSGIRHDVVVAQDAATREFNVIVRKMTALTPTLRYQSMQDVGTALRGLFYGHRVA